MNRIWGLLFIIVPLTILGLTFATAFNVGPFAGAWLPESYSDSADVIDHLWLVVHLICGFFLIVTFLFLGLSVWEFSNQKDMKVPYAKEDWKTELIWSVIPGAILLGIAIYQFLAWNDIADAGEIPHQTIKVVAKQFGWEFHYAGNDEQFDTLDDFKIENELIVPVNERVVLRLESRDVIHSFFVPKLRFKNDVVPGMSQLAWFKPRSVGELNIVCAELCGWGHYKMNAKLRIVESADYEQWFKEQQDRLMPPEFRPYSADN